MCRIVHRDFQVDDDVEVRGGALNHGLRYRSDQSIRKRSLDDRLAGDAGIGGIVPIDAGFRDDGAAEPWDLIPQLRLAAQHLLNDLPPGQGQAIVGLQCCRRKLRGLGASLDRNHRQCDMRRLLSASEHSVDAALGGRPDIREIGAGDTETDVIAFREDPTRRIDRHFQSEDLVRDERSGIGEGVPSSGIKDALRNEVRAPIRPYLAEPDDESHDTRRGGEVEDGQGLTEDRKILQQRCAVVHERQGVVGPLVSRQAEGHARRPEATRGADGRKVLEAVDACGPRLSGQRPVIEIEDPLCRLWGRPLAIRSPQPRRFPPPRIRAIVSLHIDDDGRLIHEARIDSLAPMVEPAKHGRQVVDARPRYAQVRLIVIPRTQENLSRNLQLVAEPERRVAVSVAPAADHEDGTTDALCDVTDRPVSPIGAVCLVPKPFEQIGLVALEVSLPDGAPVGIEPFCGRWHGVPGNHEAAIEARVVIHAQQAADIMTIVQVAIVREVHGNDAGQVRRRQGSALQGREASV